MEHASTFEIDLDEPLQTVRSAFVAADPDGSRAARVFRATFDQLYDGQRTGRYRWDQLFKTEKTHFGTLIEINLRREFDDIISDGKKLDFRVRDVDVDCKYSFRFGGWMIPPEAFGELLLVCTASDENSEWAMGLVRASDTNRRAGVNRDGKSGLSAAGSSNISWIHWGAELPPNVLLQLDPADVQTVFAERSGQKRLNQLFRVAVNRRIGRNTVATVAQQDDYMKRARANGGSRTTLAREGFLVMGGDYVAHRKIAEQLDITVPHPGEFVSIRVIAANGDEPHTVELDGGLWRVANEGEWDGTPAPSLPDTRQIRN